jgi:hypothetical protein
VSKPQTPDFPWLTLLPLRKRPFAQFTNPKFQIVLDSNMLINKWIAKKSITGYWVRGE